MTLYRMQTVIPTIAFPKVSGHLSLQAYVHQDVCLVQKSA